MFIPFKSLIESPEDESGDNTNFFFQFSHPNYIVFTWLNKL